LIVPDLQDVRLAFKKAFADYYLALHSPAIADPTQAFASCLDYLTLLHAQLGAQEFMYRLDDETTHLAGEIEQEIIRRIRRNPNLAFEPDPAMIDDLEDRVRECFEYALDRVMPPAQEDE
jgi:hypothetical protein